jgi:hypothetical protein
MVVTRLRPLSVGRSVAVVAMAAMLCYMLLFALLMLTDMARGWLGWEPMPRPMGGVRFRETLMPLVAVIVAGVRAFVVAVLFALIYNLFARRFRILEIEVE